MRKSPAKWIKSVLFGKKSSRSGSTKAKDLSKAANNKGYAAAGEKPSFESSPVISEPVLVASHNTETVPEVGKGENSSLQGEVAVRDVNHDLEKQSTLGSDASNDPERLREEQAAVKAQAAFRGFLARRAFRALKGIIRLQALIRGHLVRRQAVSTLRSTWLIVKFQALVRGRNVRLSNDAIQVSRKFAHQKSAGAKLDAWKDKLSSNTFARKLLASPIMVEALHFQYDERDPNSAINWLERWSIIRVWKPMSQPKRAAATDAKPQTRKASYAMETESGKLKRNARKSSAMAVEPSQTNLTLETEKTKRNPRKFTSAPTDSVPDSQLTELEKVKLSLRKVTNSMAEASKVSSPATEIPGHQEVQCEKPLRNAQEVPIYPEFEEPHNDNLLENAKIDILVPDLQPEPEVTSHPVTAEEIVDEPTVVAPAAESMLLQDINNEENALLNDVEQRSKEEPLSTESLKSGKRRSSISTKSEYPENGSKNSPALPSYMAVTESAKAKLRGQISPRLSSDSAEKNGFTRRHSLPSSTNGKLNSHSPRTQRPTHASGKEGVKGDNSTLSSRDASDLLYKDFQTDQKFTLTTYAANGAAITATSTRKNEAIFSEIQSQLKNKTLTVDVKATSDSNVITTFTVDELGTPGLKAILYIPFPYPKSTKAELQYLHDHAGINASVGLNANPLVNFSGVFGTKTFAVGADVAFDTASGDFTKYNAGVSHSNQDLTASVALNNKGDSLAASYYHQVNPFTAVGAELAHTFSSNENTLTFGTQYALDPLTTVKARFNNYGMASALIQHEWRPKSLITISTEVDTKAIEKNSKVGLSLVLKP